MSVIVTVPVVVPRPAGLLARMSPVSRWPRRIWMSPAAVLLLLLGRTDGVVAAAVGAALALALAGPVLVRVMGDVRARRAAVPQPAVSPRAVRRSADLAFVRFLAPRLAIGVLAATLAVAPSLLQDRDPPALHDRLFGVALLIVLLVQLVDPFRLWRDTRQAFADGVAPPRALGRVVGGVDGQPVVDVPGVGRLVLTEGTAPVRHLMQDDEVVLDGALARRSPVAVAAARGTGWARVRRILAEEG